MATKYLDLLVAIDEKRPVWWSTSVAVQKFLDLPGVCFREKRVTVRCRAQRYSASNTAGKAMAGKGVASFSKKSQGSTAD